MKYVQPFDQPSNPTAAYVDLNAATGTDGSIPPAKFFNDTQAEILSVITGAGLTPNAADMTQLRQAILAMIPTPTGAPSDQSLVHYGVDAGTSGALSVTPSPSFTSLAQGFQLWTIPAFDCPGVSQITLTPASGPAVTKDIRRSDGSVLQSGDFRAGELALLVYDSAGRFRLFGRAGGSLVNIRVFNSSGTYVPSVGTRRVAYLLVGGGGAGGGGISGSPGNGGGSGGFVLGYEAVSDTSTYVVTIGSGGVGVNAVGLGGDGGDSAFLTAIAGGGRGGYGRLNNGPGGAGGTASGGIFRGAGEAGSPSITNSAGPCGSPGGGSIFGGGGRGWDLNTPSGTVEGPGGNGSAPGAGGGGADSNSGHPGGNGAAGALIIFELP